MSKHYEIVLSYYTYIFKYLRLQKLFVIKISNLRLLHTFICKEDECQTPYFNI